MRELHLLRKERIEQLSENSQGTRKTQSMTTTTKKLRAAATTMVLVFDRRGSLLYACSVKCLSSALDEASELVAGNPAQVKVRRLQPRPWSDIPFTLNSLNLMTSAEA